MWFCCVTSCSYFTFIHCYCTLPHLILFFYWVIFFFFFSTPCFAESWQLWWMYSHWRLFLWPAQANVLFFGEWKHPLPWLWRERLRPGNHCHHIWLFHLEGKDWYLHKDTHTVNHNRYLLFITKFLPLQCLKIWYILNVSPQFYITKENRGNEGTCIGVSRWPVRDHNHHTTTDMWLYRAYSGNLYHGGELVRTLPSFTQGDTITCILDMEAHTISFAKNDKVWIKYSQSVLRGFGLIDGCVFLTSLMFVFFC